MSPAPAFGEFSVDRDSPRRHEEKQHADTRNRIRASERETPNARARAMRHGIFLMRLKRGKIVSRDGKG